MEWIFLLWFHCARCCTNTGESWALPQERGFPLQVCGWVILRDMSCQDAQEKGWQCPGAKQPPAAAKVRGLMERFKRGVRRSL